MLAEFREDEGDDTVLRTPHGKYLREEVAVVGLADAGLDDTRFVIA